MTRILKRIGLALAVSAVSLAGLPAKAGLVTFNFNGVNVFAGASGTTTGVGSFSFADSPTSLTLANLTGFSDVETVNAAFGGLPTRQTTFTFGLGDLTAFSATLTPGGALTSLSLITRPVSSPSPSFIPETFVVTSLSTNGAATFNNIGQQLTQGTVTPAAVPEPATLAGAAVAGLFGLAYGWRRQRASA